LASKGDGRSDYGRFISLSGVVSVVSELLGVTRVSDPLTERTYCRDTHLDEFNPLSPLAIRLKEIARSPGLPQGPLDLDLMVAVRNACACVIAVSKRKQRRYEELSDKQLRARWLQCWRQCMLSIQSSTHKCSRAFGAFPAKATTRAGRLVLTVAMPAAAAAVTSKQQTSCTQSSP
jgi:hypothetical protein